MHARTVLLPYNQSPCRSLELLLSLGALDTQGKLSHPVGTTLSKLPVDPMYAKVLLAATGMGCSIEAMQVSERKQLCVCAHVCECEGPLIQ